MDGPAVWVNAVEIAVAVHPDPAGAPRESVTWTWPSGPLIVRGPTPLDWVPRLPASPGALMDSPPPSTVTVAVLTAVGSADAGSADARNTRQAHAETIETDRWRRDRVKAPCLLRWRAIGVVR